MGYPTDKGSITPEAYQKLQAGISKLQKQLKEEQDRNHKQYQDNKTMRNILRYELEKELLRKMAAPPPPTNPWEMASWAQTFGSPAPPAAPAETPAAPPQVSQDEFFGRLKGVIRDTVAEELVSKAKQMAEVTQRREQEVNEVENYLREKRPDIAQNPGIFQGIWEETMDLAPTLSPKIRAERLLKPGGLVDKGYQMAANPYAGAAGWGTPGGGYNGSAPARQNVGNVRPYALPFVDFTDRHEGAEPSYHARLAEYNAKKENFRDNPAIF